MRSCKGGDDNEKEEKEEEEGKEGANGEKREFPSSVLLGGSKGQGGEMKIKLNMVREGVSEEN